jgi:hypothetical protein
MKFEIGRISRDIRLPPCLVIDPATGKRKPESKYLEGLSEREKAATERIILFMDYDGESASLPHQWKEISSSRAASILRDRSRHLDGSAISPLSIPGIDPNPITACLWFYGDSGLAMVMVPILHRRPGRDPVETTHTRWFTFIGCDHDWNTRKIGSCLYEERCVKCGLTHQIDSSG